MSELLVFFYIKQEKINISILNELITMDTKGDGSEKEQGSLFPWIIVYLPTYI